MKILIIYDSYFGNTKEIAYLISEKLHENNDVKIIQVDDIEMTELNDINLLIVGSPTRAFRPTANIIKFLKKIESGKLEGVKVAAFDTRVAVEDTNVKILKGMIKLFGYAAEPIAKLLAQKGGKIIVKPIGVYVDDTKGPIKDGEKEKVIKWIENVK